MYLSDLKSKILIQRAETVKTLENVNSPNPSDYRYLQGFIHCFDKIIREIDVMTESEGEDA